MHWRDRLEIIRKGPDDVPTEPTKPLLSVLAVGDRAIPEGDNRGQRAHLLALTADEGLPAELVHGLDDADVAACDGLPDDVLRGYLRALKAGQRMDAGMVPPEWGEPVARTCDGCGPVLLWPDCPPRVKACPWCFRRKAGKEIQRPLVACAECRHFRQSAANLKGGAGSCALGHPGKGPMKPHRCADWRRQ